MVSNQSVWRRLVILAGLAIFVPLLTSSSAWAASPNWQTKDDNVVCEVTYVFGTAVDPGTQAPLNGDWPGLQCSAGGVPRPKHGIGDPFVQLGQGQAGRAKVVDESQNDLIFYSPFITLSPGTTWRRGGISCHIRASQVRCSNAFGHGFALSTGRLKLF